MKENLLRKEIEYHIETARSTENKADKIQRELEIIKMKEKADSKLQTRYSSLFKIKNLILILVLLRIVRKKFPKNSIPQLVLAAEKVAAQAQFQICQFHSQFLPSRKN